MVLYEDSAKITGFFEYTIILKVKTNRKNHIPVIKNLRCKFGNDMIFLLKINDVLEATWCHVMHTLLLVKTRNNGASLISATSFYG